jgi:hypothetical protein
MFRKIAIVARKCWKGTQAWRIQTPSALKRSPHKKPFIPSFTSMPYFYNVFLRSSLACVGDHGSNSSKHIRSFRVFLLSCWRLHILTSFFLSLLSFFICCHKICDFFQNKKPYFANSRICIPCASRCSNNHIQLFEYPCHLFPPLMDKFMVQHFHKIVYGPINDVIFLLNKL